MKRSMGKDPESLYSLRNHESNWEMLSLLLMHLHIGIIVLCFEDSNLIQCCVQEDEINVLYYCPLTTPSYVE